MSTLSVTNIEGLDALTVGGSTLSDFGKTLIDDADAATARTTLGLSTASQAEMEAGTESALRSMSPLLVSQAISALSLGTISIQTFTASGTYTKPAGLTYALVIATGGGAGGSQEGAGDTGSGGGAGGTAIKLLAAASIGATETVTVGAGGAASGSVSNNGNDTTFGAHCTGGAGQGGGNDAGGGATLGGVGGTATGGDLNIPGGYGSGATSVASEYYGGSSFWGGTGAYGSGGVGASNGFTTAVAADSGGGGVVVVIEFRAG